MCGIVGILSKKSGQCFLVDEAKRMADSLAHRGPDESLVYGMKMIILVYFLIEGFQL